MSLILELPPGLEAHLAFKARQRGLDIQKYAGTVLQTLNGIFGASQTGLLGSSSTLLLTVENIR